ncbi:MAG: hypothetical protein AB1921_17340 [Thermodesulfobacteriota bacterium]
MAFWRRFLGKPKMEDKPVTALGRMVSDRVETLAREIFLAHKSALINEPSVLSGPPSRSGSRMTATWQEILRKIGPAPAQVIASLDLKNLTPSQESAIALLVRNLIMARVACMVEQSRYAEREKLRREGVQGLALNDMEPMGNA